MTPSTFVAAAFTSALLALLVAGAAAAAEVSIFRQDERPEALAGEVSGTSVGADGELRLAPHFERLAGLDEPFLFAAAMHPEGGAVLGTGAQGKVFRVDGEGIPRLLGTLEEPSVFAVHVTGDGEVLAAGSPDGKVVRVGETLEEIFAPEATYIWDLVQDRDGRVLVATGLPGRVYRLSQDLSEAELIYESADRHVRTLLPRADGSLVIGTAGQGLIVELAADGEARTLYDAAEPEVLAFAEEDGVLYAALLASEASQVDLSAVSGAEAEGAASGQETIGSRASSYEGPRSRLIALEDQKTPRVLAELKDETVHALALFAGDLWLGTGQEGGLYRLEKEELILEKSFEESQLIALLPDEEASVLLAATTDSVALHRFDGGREESGSFTSRILDAGHAARFGVLRWWGEGADSRVRFEVRSGMAEKPDATWSQWQGLDEVAGDGTDLEVGPSVGVARYAQWRATLERGGEGDTPRIDAVELSYRQLNQAPRIAELEVLDHGQILVSQSFNPTSTTFEPWSPNRDGIFTRLRAERNDGQLKTLWKRGYRTLRFKAEDPNGDELRFTLEVRQEPVDGEQGAWLPVAEDLEESWFSFDSTVLPDGVYRFRLEASDAAENSHGDALSDHRRSEPVVIDHTPPYLLRSSWREGGFDIVAGDDLHPIKDAVYSVDAGPWRPAKAADGLLDSRRERLSAEVPEDAGLVLLRLTDAALNVVTFSLGQR